MSFVQLVINRIYRIEKLSLKILTRLEQIEKQKYAKIVIEMPNFKLGTFAGNFILPS
jgi:hypothetical protein